MRILVVEDEHKIANAITQGLRHESYAVDVVYDGIKGYDFASGEEYDVIILDRMLPGMEGAEMTKRLRSENIHTPILLLTAKGQVSERVEGLNSGADDYLVKPFAFEELLARVRSLARRPERTLSMRLILKDLEIDGLTFEVKRQGKHVKLSSKEYALLEYLMRHPNQIVSKKQIIDHVWDYEANILPNTVEVYIGYLRNKIDKPFPNTPPLIHTVRGFGYKIGN
ncbi:MAG: response regulator transcription factor [Candidatus Levybacteria bacterium]|nr:response regulator transcription factor [Candidatus Levybacteria bacterium]